jgi:hypothetical protein
MSVFSWIGDLFGPISELVDEVYFSGEEEAQAKAKMAEIKSKMAQIEAQVATKTLEFQSELVKANTKIATAEQEHGNWLSKSWRPVCSLGSFTMLMLMGIGYIPFNEYLSVMFGSFLGIHGGGRSYEKTKK